MIRTRFLATLVALIALPQASAKSEPVTHGPYFAVGDDGTRSAAPGYQCVPPEMYETLRQVAPSERPGPGMPSALLPLYRWPIERALNDELVLINYVDDDTTTALAE